MPPKPAAGCGPVISADAPGPASLRQQIFERVRASGGMARAEVARKLSVSPASVTSLSADLIERGLLREVALPRAPVDGIRGRPPVVLEVAPHAHLVAGIKMSDRHHTAVITDFAGNILADETAEMPGDDLGCLESLLDTALDLVTRSAAKAGVTIGDLSCVGLGVPGFVDHADGAVLWSPLLNRRNVALAETATEVLGVPVTIDNDANLVALAELWFGAGRMRPEFAVVTIEHGVGMGLVINHRLLRGARGLGMELGHTKVQLDGALCRCGQRGCLEAYVADYAMVREATTALNWHSKDSRPMTVQLESLYDHAKAGNMAARSVFDRAGRYLAVGLANVINLFDPGLIILSGERMRYDYLYAEETLAELEALVLTTGRPLPEITVRTWGDMLWATGAAALALSCVTDAAFDGVSEGAGQ